MAGPEPPMAGPELRDGSNYGLYWGDLHKHLTGPGAPIEDVGEKLAGAREHLDFCSAYCYPFDHYRQGEGGGSGDEAGIRMETTGGRPQFEEWWAEIQERSAEYHEPGEFVTFPAYEWHGNRRRWGDHHVVYREEGHPLDDAADVGDLFENLADRPAIAVPHHTGYRVGERGKDWDVHDRDLSPVMEIYSTHGSSEGVDTPVPMDFNDSMGPRTSGGTFHDALDRGRRVGVVASNDGPGVPGAWNRGLAAVWATDHTREAIWDAILERRTYGVTGDRMALWWTLGGEPMGSVIEPGGDVEGTVSVDCPQPLDRVELLRNGRVHETYAHLDRREDSTARGAETTASDGVYRQLVEFGWGPAGKYGDFGDTDVRWEGEIEVDGGDLRRVYPRFVGAGQSYAIEEDRCRFSLLTGRDEGPTELPEGVTRASRQALVVEYGAEADASLRLDLDGRETLSVPLADAEERDHLFAFTGEAAARIESAFGIAEEDIDNFDRRYHNSPKVDVHRAYPRSACAAEVSFADLPARDGDAYYVRASQVDGQYAWSSPIWVAE